MTSKRLYAVATVVLCASLPLGACFPAGSSDGEAEPETSATTYPPPAYTVSHQQAKVIAVVGQRLADGRTSEPVTDEFYAIDFCKAAPGITMAEAEPWSTVSRITDPSASDPSDLSESETAQLGLTLAQVVVLGPSPTSMDWAEEKFQRGLTCPDYDGTPLTTQRLAVPGATTSLVRTRANLNTVGLGAHSAMGAARVANVLLFCTADSATAPVALTTVTSCLTEMVQAVPLAAEQNVEITDANKDVATKMLLAQLAGSDLRAAVRPRTATEPCHASRTSFVPDGTIGALIQTEKPPTTDDPESSEAGDMLALLAAERQRDPAAARAKVAMARAKFGKCSGRYSRGEVPDKQRGEVTDVSDVPFGDGGFMITRTVELDEGSTPATGQEAIFSIGSYVMQLSSTAPDRAADFAARLEIATRS